MVDLGTLANDLAQVAAFYLGTPLLWLFLFLFVWSEAALARRGGFDRRVFWLLVVGGFVGFLSDLPIFPWNGNILAVNLSGGAIPVALAFGLLARHPSDPGGHLGAFLTGLVAMSGMMLAIVFALPPGALADAAYLAALIAPPAALLAIGRGTRSGGGSPAYGAGTWLAVTSVVLGLTFATTATVPNLGIVSQFPYYLAGPVAGGVLAVALTRVRRRPVEEGLALAYALTTLGVLLGADLLRQPPLYATGSNVYAIGGAGPLDLVYVSGLLALAVAYLTIRLARLEREPPAAVDHPGASRTPAGRLRHALLLGARGRPTESLRESAQAATDAGKQSRRLLGLPPPGPAESAWKDLPVASWVVAYDRNLQHLGERGPAAPEDAYRGWLTSRWLVRLGRDLGRRRFAPLGGRVAAFFLDLLVVTLPAVAVWVAIVLGYASDPSGLLSSALFNAAISGFSAFAFLYLVVGEWGYGTTLGKKRLGLEVRDRSMGSPGATAVLVRNLPKLIPLTLIGLGGPILTAVALLGPSALGGGVSGPAAALDVFLTSLVVLAFVLLGIGASGAVSALVITTSSESQRFGDLLAGTWVVRRAVTEAASGPPAAPSAGPGPFG